MIECVQVVWFKRDLRLRDHGPLTSALAAGPVLPLFIWEPSLLRAADWDALHSRFIGQSLVELRAGLRVLGGELIVRSGEVVEVLESLHASGNLAALWSHEETGNALTYTRDRAVATWARSRQVSWVELPQHGVIRRLRDRNGWAARWEKQMHQPAHPTPQRVRVPQGLDPGPLRPPYLGCDEVVRDRALVQRGGEVLAWETLQSFFAGRGARYTRAMSSPLDGATACSRLSPYLAWGCLSIREALQASEAATAALADRGYRTENGVPFLRASPRSLLGRLHWHCHFIQKLESEPAIEHRCFHRAYEALRPPEADPVRLLAWCEGRTGYPLVDACMRSLRSTGWLNFRMRAMLVSFAAYDLWLDWRTFRDYLARQFLDYEPGIHFSQLQMQSGVTGINAIRIYNPVKQGLDQDPTGDFIRRWVPELARVPGPAIHTPWRLSPLEQKETGSSAYPAPIVDHSTAMRAAKVQITALRASGNTLAEARRVFAQHGSRRRRPDPRVAARRAKGIETKRPPSNPDQLDLEI